MEEECSQWENIAGEFLENEIFYQAANQYKHAADCYLDKVIEMTRKAAENYHIYAEQSVEKDDHKSAATAYFEAATQYREVSDYATALTLYENAAKEALLVRRTETAAQANLWAAFSCHKLGNKEYFLTCAKNMGDLYSKAAEKALDDGKAERAVIDYSLAAMGFATIDKIRQPGWDGVVYSLGQRASNIPMVNYKKKVLRRRYKFVSYDDFLCRFHDSTLYNQRSRIRAKIDVKTLPQPLMISLPADFEDKDTISKRCHIPSIVRDPQRSYRICLQTTWSRRYKFDLLCMPVINKDIVLSVRITFYQVIRIRNKYYISSIS